MNDYYTPVSPAGRPPRCTKCLWGITRDCARRELALRKRVYPGLVNARRMPADKCRHEIECMEEIVTVLVRLKADGGTAAQRQLGF